MKTRRSYSRKRLPSVDIVMVYTYDSTLCDEDQDEDADLNPFRCRVKTCTDIMDTDSPKKIRRSGTDIAKHQSETSVAFQVSRDRQAHLGELSNYTKGINEVSVNWLNDDNMLEWHIPGSRISTIGFDLSPKSSGLGDLESAAEQLNDYLNVLRNGHRPPVLFLGHGYGSLIITSALTSASSSASRFNNVLRNAAGLFDFAYPVFNQEANKNVSVGQKYEDIDTRSLERLQSSALKILCQTVDGKLFSVVKQEHEALQDTGPESNAHSRSQVVAIALLFFHSIVSFQQRPSDTQFNKMLGVPPQFVVMGK